MEYLLKTSQLELFQMEFISSGEEEERFWSHISSSCRPPGKQTTLDNLYIHIWWGYIRIGVLTLTHACQLWPNDPAGRGLMVIPGILSDGVTPNMGVMLDADVGCGCGCGCDKIAFPFDFLAAWLLVSGTCSHFPPDFVYKPRRRARKQIENAPRPPTNNNNSDNGPSCTNWWQLWLDVSCICLLLCGIVVKFIKLLIRPVVRWLQPHSIPATTTTCDSRPDPIPT